MKKHATSSILTFVLCLGLSHTSLTIQAQTTWQLIWSDEFSGTTLDATKWAAQFGNGGWGNNEWQYYTNAPENLALENGQLVITARHEGTGATEYTSARIQTKGLFDFEYGKVEARMKLPLGQGLWPAFWTLGANIDDVSWPECGEIDIMEHVSNEYVTHGAVHWENNGHAFVGQGNNVDPTQYHVYGIVWEENLIRWYVDGIQFFQFAIQASNNTDDAFRHPMFLLLNLAVGGNWPGYPDATTPFPSSMFVDYVRVYQPATSSIADESALQIQCYPNPTSDKLTVSAPSAMQQVRLINTLGEVVADFGQQQSQTTLDCTPVAAGVYTLTVECAEGSFSYPVVIE
ncbi:MAG: family 16 glycosylhydrolase [Flavobacteriales bacterium]|jgi:beta-glucanase (GH16 family)